MCLYNNSTAYKFICFSVWFVLCFTITAWLVSKIKFQFSSVQFQLRFCLMLQLIIIFNVINTAYQSNICSFIRSHIDGNWKIKKHTRHMWIYGLIHKQNKITNTFLLFLIFQNILEWKTKNFIATSIKRHCIYIYLYKNLLFNIIAISIHFTCTTFIAKR